MNPTVFPEVTADDCRKARVPHEILLTNLIVNHILVFVATLGMATHNPEPVMLVPLVSFALLAYTIWRNRSIRRAEGWFVRVHWEAAAAHSRLFLALLAALCLVAAVAWMGYAHFGLRREAAIALAAGLVILPTMVAVLLLVVMESDLLHHAMHGRVPARFQRRYPRPEGAPTPRG